MVIQTWQQALAEVKQSQGFNDTLAFIKASRNQGKTIYPPQTQLFNALKLTPFKQVKVVILGQDPYHRFNQANGLAFSVNKGIAIPPSLRNIYKEIAQDLGQKCANHGDLSQWANSGVLLLNAVLSVEAGQANSHSNKGWERFTDTVISSLTQAEQHIVFMLWGSYAQKKIPLISKQHTILKAPHPSPLSAYRGFFGCRHFSQANKALTEHQQTPIDWVIV